MKTVRLLALLAGGALIAAMIVGASHNGIWPPLDTAIIGWSVAFVSLVIGVVVWQVRPESRTGLYLTAGPLVGLLADLPYVFSDSPLAVTVGFALHEAAIPLLALLVLTYPTGRITSSLDRVLIWIAVVYAAVYGLVLVLLYDPRPGYEQTIQLLQPHAAPLTHIGSYDVTGIRSALDVGLGVLAVVFLAALARKLVRATPGGRRVVLPLALAAGFAAAQYLVQLAVLGAPANSWSHRHIAWVWIVNLASLAVPVSLAAGLLWGRRARAVVADLVVELERTPPGSVRDALAHALGDPTLELALWLPERGSYVDADGRPFALPASRPDRAVTVMGTADAPVAALVHDPVLLERRALLTSASAAARLALENERLQAELRAQLAELRVSRARIVTAGDEERRRLERDLHDGAQQRLLSLGLALQLARARLGPDANGAGDLLDEADCELRAALDELRELARGIHPAVLSEQGLAAAVRSLAERSPVPVAIAGMPDHRLSAATEVAAYFVVSEALTNVAKYADASRVQVRVMHVDSRVLVDVDDDGVGGADPAKGSGLRGLADRVHALDGELELESAPGCGTHLRAEIPCA
jgi:signal transduction histidine kinase